MNKIKNKFYILFIFFNCLVINAQSNNTCISQIYKTLNDKSLSFIEFSDQISTTKGKYLKENNKTNFILLEISKSINLKFKKFTYTNPSPPYVRDTLFLFRQKYCIDNLFYNKKTLKNEEPLRLNYASGYMFTLNFKKYVSLFFWDSNLPTTHLMIIKFL